MNFKSMFKLACVSLLVVQALFFVGCGTTPNKSTGGGASTVLSKVDQTLFNQGVKKLKDGAFDKAQRDFKILLTRRPDVAAVWVNYGLSLYQQQKFDELASAVTDMEKRGFDISERYNLQGNVEVDRGDYKKAVESYKQAIKLNNGYALGWYNLALVYDVYLQQVPTAIKYYQAYLKLMPDDEDTKNWVEHLQYSVGEDQ